MIILIMLMMMVIIMIMKLSIREVKDNDTLLHFRERPSDIWDNNVNVNVHNSGVQLNSNQY